jgi:hypothetical protein
MIFSKFLLKFSSKLKTENYPYFPIFWFCEHRNILIFHDWNHWEVGGEAWHWLGKGLRMAWLGLAWRGVVYVHCASNSTL